MKRIIDQFSRYFVGCLFIFSGLIKLNDPIGTAIKMEEYFEVFAQDFGSMFHHFIPWSLEIAMIMIVLELALGVAILIQYKMEITTWILLGLMVFFTFLTFYSAVFNKVTDCGCFGDAIKLTPWQSFEKDLVLMVFVLHLFWYRRTYEPAFKGAVGNAIILTASVLFTFVGIYAIMHLPFLDFRAYRIGNNIPAQMVPAAQPIIEYTFTKAGKEVQSKKYIADSGYTYVSSRVLNESEIKPKITDYSVSGPKGEDLTQSTFEGVKLLFIIADVHKASLKNIEHLKSLSSALSGQVETLILTSSLEDDIEKFRHENQLAIPYAYSDATVLKTIIRSNPGVALWKNGTVLGNWHNNDIPTAEEVLALIKQ